MSIEIRKGEYKYVLLLFVTYGCKKMEKFFVPKLGWQEIRQLKECVKN